MILDYEPGDKVVNPAKKEWGIGQVQSIIGNKVTINFENAGKQVINVEEVKIEKYERFCQLIIVPINPARFSVVTTLPGTKRGDGGFGSTGTKKEGE